jgi:threonine/homoserine/homoserine lactone efflux protein
MTDPTAFVLAVLVVLLTPGPTNTLLVIAAATNGRRRALFLIPAEILGYFISICALILIVGRAIALSPALGMSLRIGCALYLAYIAYALWHGSGDSNVQRSTRFQDVFVTTLLNPKALVFALAIFPNSPQETFGSLWPYFAAFGATCIVVACIWIGFGTILRAGVASYLSQARFQRFGAIVLGCFATLLVGSVLKG